MKQEYEEKQKVIEIPPNTGVEGYLHVVREAFKLPKIFRIILDIGKVTVVRRAKKGETEEPNLNAQFDHLEPYNVIRNAAVKELSYPETLNASAAIAALLDAAVANGYTPIAFVTGAQTILWSWLYFRDDLEVHNRESLFGYPLHADRRIPDTALVLCAGVDKTEALIDTRLSIKIEMKHAQPLLEEVGLDEALDLGRDAGGTD